MNEPENTYLQIHVYSKEEAEQIFQKLKQFDPIIENWNWSDDGSYPIPPLFFIFMKASGEFVQLALDAVSDFNFSAWTTEDKLRTAKYPTSQEEHRIFCRISEEQYQNTFPLRKFHPQAEKNAVQSVGSFGSHYQKTLDRLDQNARAANKVLATKNDRPRYLLF